MSKAVVALGFLFLICATEQVAAAPEVATIAGSGVAGIKDGPALRSTFLFPSGIAIAKDGSVYVSDSLAQRIRILTPSGQVRTVAGSGPMLNPQTGVLGGYRDGPALQARLNGPEGLAIGPDGALYIADSLNGCIRRLAREQVMAFAGKCGEPGSVDGPRLTARLNRPAGIVFDAAGNLYIADDQVGLRKLDKSGVLTTLHFKNYHGSSARGLAFVSSPEPVIFESTLDGLIAYHPATGEDEWLGATQSSTPSEVAALDGRQLLFTDLRSNDIRYLRLAALPFAGQFSQIIAGGAFEWGPDNIGFADGRRSGARFQEPMGIAVTGNRAIVADAGNHRIREITLPHFRVTETGFSEANKPDQHHYEVALIGASWTFWDASGDDSICAQIERTLDASHRFHKPVRCHTVTMNGALSAAMEDYIKSVFAYQRMDLIIMDAESWSYYHLPGDKVAGGVTYAELFRAHMRQLLNVLEPMRTQLALVWVYPAQLTSNAEWIIDQPPGAFRALPFDRDHEISSGMEAALRGMPILQYDMYEDMIKYQLSDGALPLYRSNDQHPNPRGNAFFGAHFAQALLRQGLRPK